LIGSKSGGSSEDSTIGCFAPAGMGQPPFFPKKSKMKIAYLFLVHNNPKLIRKTIERLSTPDCAFFVHVDAKANIDEFSFLQSDNVRFTDKRVPVFWGEFSQVEGMLVLIRQALASIHHYDYLVLLSGSHYPLQSGAYIQNFFEASRGTEFMTLVQMPNEQAGKPLSRLNTLRFPSDRPFLRFAFRLLAKVNLATRDYRKYFGNLKPYAGNTWWGLSREACQHIVDFHDRDHRVADFFVNSFASDESYFHTILGNSSFRARMRRNLVYEDWKGQNAHPAMIKSEHISYFESMKEVCVEDHHGPGELLFARKFSDEDFRLLERIDTMIETKQQLYQSR
jgi:hypothetical protein